MKNSITVKFIGAGLPKSENTIWGGSVATYSALVNSFKDDPIVKFDHIGRSAFLVDGQFDVDKFKKFVKYGDIVHVDDTRTLENMYANNLPAPDVIGPVARSPLKTYSDNWQTSYPANWFYSAKVIRLNYSEERNNHELIMLIRHGIDTNRLIPNDKEFKKYVLWAGMIPRYAKNYPLMEEIMKITTLPEPYEFKVLSQYNVADYWKVLDNTAVFINTSRYESFCNALFEARAKGVATIQPVLLNGPGVHVNAPVQVEYTPEAYRAEILNQLENNKFIETGKECREYCENTASFKIMRDDIYKIYEEIMKTKRSFVNNYFEGKSGEALKKTITPSWTTTANHLKLLNIPPVNSIAEIGCGIGRLLVELNFTIPVCVGFDASKDMIREGTEYCKNSTVKLNLCDGFGSIPTNETFDYVFSFTVFQHIPNTDTVKKYIGEAYRILNSTGTFQFQILADDEFPEKDLWSWHDPSRLMDHMKTVGFVNIKKEQKGRWLFIKGSKK